MLALLDRNLAKKLLTFYALAESATVAYAQWLDITWQSDPVGPDGPWNALLIGVDGPTQNLSWFPSLTRTSLLINESACSLQEAACPLPIPTTWDSTGHTNFVWMNGNPWEANTTIDNSETEPLKLQGQGQYIHQTFRTFVNEQGTQPSITDQAVSVSNNITANFPGGAQYTLDTGLFSLYGGATNLSWTATNGSEQNFYLALPAAKRQGITSSVSYGLHIGSGTYGIEGSLMIGAYDKSRVLTDPISSSNSTFELVDIGLEVQSGISKFIGLPNGNVSGLLQSSSSSSAISVLPNPGVPYMYLPQATCDRIAQHLPVTYNPDFGLYFWSDTLGAGAEMAKKITSSPHVLTFQFRSNGETSTIEVPFALLNLTLESPLVSTTTQYFPCSPYTPNDGSTYHLGRAFLQAAFLGQNWDTNTTWLAQAPGPDVPPKQQTRIGASDTTLTAMTNGPAASATWSKTLKAITGAATMAKTSSSLSGGAIAGIVIGVLAVVVIAVVAILLCRRRRKRAIEHNQEPEDLKQYPLADQNASPEQRSSVTHDYQHEYNGQEIAEAPQSEIHEMGGRSKIGEFKPLELPDRKPIELSSQFPPSELQGSEVGDAEGKAG